MWTTLFIWFFVAIAVSFVCSLLEATVLSISPAHVESLEKSGDPAGRRLKRLRDRIDRPLIAILTCNTLANMFGAAGVGNEAGKLAREHGGSDAEAIWVVAASTVLTFAILILSEIVPKTLGATYWRPLSMPAGLVLTGLVWIMSPIVRVLEVVPRLVGGAKGVERVTREEVAATAKLGELGGAVGERMGRVIENSLALDAVRAKEVLTPRVEMGTVQKEETAEAIEGRMRPMRFSRMPVFGEADEFVGMVLRQRIFEAIVRGKGETTVGELMGPVRFVPETASVSTLLEFFIDHEEHAVLVVDEHGSVEGLVTMEDVIESLLGVEIMDEYDTVADLRELALARAAARRKRRRGAGGRATQALSGGVRVDPRDGAHWEDHQESHPVLSVPSRPAPKSSALRNA